MCTWKIAPHAYCYNSQGLRMRLPPSCLPRRGLHYGRQGQIENFFVGNHSGQVPNFDDDLIDSMSAEVVEKTSRLFNAGKPKAGEMEVVLGAGESGILLHEAMGHAFEADFNRKNLSIFSDKMGKKIAEDFVSIVDDGTIPGNRGTLNFDDEGNPTEKTVLVNNGILTSYLHDRISADYYKVNPTGNGRRESFRHIPMPRMNNLHGKWPP